MPSGLISMSFSASGAIRISAASFENGSLDSPWKDRAQSTCEGSLSLRVNGWSEKLLFAFCIGAWKVEGLLAVVGLESCVDGSWARKALEELKSDLIVLDCRGPEAYAVWRHVLEVDGDEDMKRRVWDCRDRSGAKNTMANVRCDLDISRLQLGRRNVRDAMLTVFELRPNQSRRVEREVGELSTPDLVISVPGLQMLANGAELVYCIWSPAKVYRAHSNILRLRPLIVAFPFPAFSERLHLFAASPPIPLIEITVIHSRLLSRATGTEYSFVPAV